MERNRPKVSVIVPIYNVEKYLRECLDSLESQTMDELEIILINDGSTDHSGIIAKEYAERRPELFHYIEQENRGLSAARNRGVEIAHGEYIAFVDSDDYVAKEIYQQMYTAGKKDDADIVCCGYNTVDQENTKTIYEHRFHSMHFSGHSVREYPELLLDCKSYAVNKLYRPWLLQKLPFPVGQKYEDSAVVYNILELANRITLVNKNGYYYRIQRAGSITTSTEGLMDVFKSMNSMVTFFSERGLMKEYQDELAYLCSIHLLKNKRIKKQLAAAKKTSAVTYVNHAYDFLDQYFPKWRKNKYFLQKKLWTSEYWFALLLYHNRVFFLCAIWLRIAMHKELLSPSSSKEKAHETNRKITKEVQKDQKMIYQTVHRFCKEHGLCYYAAEGSLLESVSEKGFIPENGHIELAMPRKDYEELIALWNHQMISGCRLASPETCQNYDLPYAKVVQAEGARAGSFEEKKTPQSQELSISIFPLDKTAAYDSPAEIARVKKIGLIREMMRYKKRKTKNVFRRLSCMLHGADFLSMRRLQAKLKKLCMKYDGQDAPFLASYGSSRLPMNAFFAKEWWGDPQERLFDDTVIMLPQRADYILSTIYGAYEERCSGK